MRTITLAVCLSLCVCVCHAQVAVTKDARALTSAQRSLAAMGGPTALALVKDSRASGKITVPGLKATFPIVIKTSGTRKVRVELQRASGTQVRILNNGYAAIIAADGKVRRLTANNTISERVTHIPVFSLLAEQGAAEVEVLPGNAKEKVAPNASFVLQIVRGSEHSAALYRKFTRTTYYVDTGTGLVSRIAFNNLAENNDPDSAITVEVAYSDYRNVDGVMVPFKQITYMSGQVESELAIDSVAFNVSISDSEFALPEVANAK